MSRRCEHGKDSQICVLCWEEANLEPRIMNEPTKLTKRKCAICGEDMSTHPYVCRNLEMAVEKVTVAAVEPTDLQKADQLRNAIDYIENGRRGHWTSSNKPDDLILSAAKQLSSLQAQRILDDGNIARMQHEGAKAEVLIDSLKSALKECAELINTSRAALFCEGGHQYLVCEMDKALVNPLVKQVLEGK